MKKVPKLLVLAFFTTWMITFVGCKKDAEIPTLTTSALSDITPTSAATGGNVTFNGGVEVTAKGVCWSITENPTTYNSTTNDGAGVGAFSSNLTGLNPGTLYFVRAFAVNSAGIAYGTQLHFTTASAPDQNQKADFPGGARNNAVGFSIGSKVYVGLGYFETNDNGTLYKDFWEWDQTTNVWTKKADYPGASTDGAVGFSIGTKGYIETGINYGTLHVTNEFWEYDPATDKWAEKSSVPGDYGRSCAVGFSIGTKGYIGTGYNWQVHTSLSYYKDFWEWDQTTDVWTKKADFPGNARSFAVGFSIGNKGYIGTGLSYDTAESYYQDLWEWDQATDAWTQKADLPGNGRASAVGFSVGNKGYIGTGYNNHTSFNSKKDFWEWDQSTNVWIQKANLAGVGRQSAVGVSIGNKGYIATGFGGNAGGYLQDLWEYDPNLK